MRELREIVYMKSRGIMTTEPWGKTTVTYGVHREGNY